MSKPTRNLTVTLNEIIIDWVPLVAPLNGNSTITSYNLQWQNQGIWQDLYGVGPDATQTRFVLTSDFIRG